MSDCQLWIYLFLDPRQIQDVRPREKEYYVNVISLNDEEIKTGEGGEKGEGIIKSLTRASKIYRKSKDTTYAPKNRTLE